MSVNRRAEPPPESTRSPSHAPRTDSDLEQLLTPKETAQFLRVSESWLAKARMRGDGPQFVKYRRSIHYPKGKLLQWIRSHLRQSTSEQ
jgi:hypothetical protein